MFVSKKKYEDLNTKYRRMLNDKNGMIFDLQIDLANSRHLNELLNERIKELEKELNKIAKEK